MKQYLGISRDHSGSMAHLKNAAMSDYNNVIKAIKTASDVNKIDTIVSVVSHQGSIKREVTNSSVNSLKALTSYPTPGSSTPLFDSVGELIEMLKASPDANDKDVTFLVMAVTDGYDNSSSITGRELGQRIRALQNTDKWTFVFRVPRGGERRSLEALGIPPGNIQEWDQTEYGLREATDQTSSAISQYYGNVSRGIRSTSTFYADLSAVSRQDVKRKLADISHEVQIWTVGNRTSIQDFFEARNGFYRKGDAFYQLSKTEKEVQDYKVIVIRNKNTHAVYAGHNARMLLNLPISGTIRLAPGNHGEWDIFIQSTSSNRILLPGTSVLYWRQ